MREESLVSTPWLGLCIETINGCVYILKRTWGAMGGASYLEF